jgi:hypothetical protein
MKTLKVALLAATAAGAVAAGGVTYATVGNSSPAPSAQHATDAVVKHAPVQVPAVPATPSVPTCLPNLPKGKALDAAKAKVEQQIQALAAKAPQTPVALPGAPGLPSSLPADQLAKLPVGKLPTCKGGDNGAVTPPHVPAGGLPDVPALPSALSCDSVPAVIKNQEARARELPLPNGMQFGVSHAHRIQIQSRAACEYTQALVGGLGGLITVQRIQTPPQVTLQELAQSLDMAGSFVKVDGVDTWTSPLNQGMLWFSTKGYAIRVDSTNPTAAALIPAIASQLRTQ